MCCTFGDKTDIEWFKKHKLPLRVSITPYGKMTDLAGQFAGLKIKEARKAVLSKLNEDGILLNSKSIVHAVNVHERSGTKLSIYRLGSGLSELMERKDELVALAR